MKLVLAMLAALLIVGCCGNVQSVQPRNFTAQGWVRSVWSDSLTKTVIFEGENGVIFSIPINSRTPPPVWQGLHCVITYESDPDSTYYYKNIVVVKRLDR